MNKIEKINYILSKNEYNIQDKFIIKELLALYRNELIKQYSYYKSNPNKQQELKQKALERYHNNKTNKEFIEHRKNYAKQYQQNNREKIREHQRQYRLRQKQKRQEQ